MTPGSAAAVGTCVLLGAPRLDPFVFRTAVPFRGEQRNQSLFVQLVCCARNATAAPKRWKSVADTHAPSKIPGFFFITGDTIK